MIAIITTPNVYLLLRIRQAQKAMLIQTFLTNTRIEWLNISIVGWLVGPTEVQLHMIAIRPYIQLLRDELWTIKESRDGFLCRARNHRTGRRNYQSDREHTSEHLTGCLFARNLL